MKRIFIIHGWTSTPKSNWKPWLKIALEKRGFKVLVPVMPDTNRPKIGVWVKHLAKIVGTPDNDCYFIGHSVGCQTILRYLQSQLKNVKVGGVIFVAGWVHLKPEAFEDVSDEQIMKPWIETPIAWRKILTHTKNFVAIFSDNDSFVPIEDAKIFRENLGAKIIIEHKKGHFSSEDSVFELPVALESLLKISK